MAPMLYTSPSSSRTRLISLLSSVSAASSSARTSAKWCPSADANPVSTTATGVSDSTSSVRSSGPWPRLSLRNLSRCSAVRGRFGSEPMYFSTSGSTSSSLTSPTIATSIGASFASRSNLFCERSSDWALIFSGVQTVRRGSLPLISS